MRAGETIRDTLPGPAGEARAIRALQRGAFGGAGVALAPALGIVASVLGQAAARGRRVPADDVLVAAPCLLVLLPALPLLVADLVVLGALSRSGRAAEEARAVLQALAPPPPTSLPPPPA